MINASHLELFQLDYYTVHLSSMDNVNAPFAFLLPPTPRVPLSPRQFCQIFRRYSFHYWLWRHRSYCQTLQSFKSLSPTKTFLRNPSINKQWKFRMYTQVIQAMILYACESQVLTPTQVKRLDAFRFRVMRAILGIKSAFYKKIIAHTGVSSSHLQVAKLASRNGFKGQILSQAATTRILKLFGHIARHPESFEHKIIYRSCHSFRSRSSPYRLGRPRAHWAEVTSAQLIQTIVWLTQKPPPHDWDISRDLRKPISQPEVWYIHGHSLHDFHKKNSAQIWRATRQNCSNRDRWKYLSAFSVNKGKKLKKKRP